MTTPISLTIFLGNVEVGVSATHSVPAVGDYIEYLTKNSPTINIGKVVKVFHRRHPMPPVITITPVTN
jgi:hypothetical protein